MAELLSDKFRKSIEDTDFTDQKLSDLYDAVKGMSDEDFKEYMYVNRGYFKKNMPAAVEEVAGFQGYVSEEPSWGSTNIDYEKVTGSSDALDKMDEYDMKDMEYFGSKAGLSGKEFLHQMTQDKIANDRKKIAHGEDEGGWFESPKSFAKNVAGAAMNVMAPRTQEAIERGEQPTIKDRVLDIAENAAQSLPVGKIAKVPAATKAFGLRNILANAAVPVASETADYIAYDEDNQRGSFDPFDVVKGTGVNIMMPRILRRTGSDNWSNVGKNVSSHIPILQKGPAGDISDIVSNKTGNVLYSNRQTPLPIVGGLLEKEQKEQKVNKAKEKKKESATKKWLLEMNKEND